MSGEAVFATRSHEEEDLAEETLAAAGITFDIRLDAFDDSGTVCHLSTVYDVQAEEAPRAREALRKAGLAHGVIA